MLLKNKTGMEENKILKCIPIVAARRRSDINSTGGIIDKGDYSYSLNDLVFRDYGIGVKFVWYLL